MGHPLLNRNESIDEGIHAVVASLDRTAAPLHAEAKDRWFYHGTSSQKAADAILTEGIQPPNPETKSRAQMAPAHGRIYITPNLGYAAIYALGANMFGHAPWKDFDRNGEYGYIFALWGEDLAGDLVPDEDSIGSMLSSIYALDKAKQRLAEAEQGNPRWNEAWQKDFKRTIEHESEKPINQPGAESVRSNLKSIAEQVMTDNQRKKVLNGNISGQAGVGKKVQPRLSALDIQWMLDHGAHAAHLGMAHPVKAWRFKKTDAESTTEDDVLSIAEEVPLPLNKTAAPLVLKRKTMDPTLKQNLKAFLDEVLGATSPNPFNPRERLWENKAVVECSEWEGKIDVATVRSLEKGEGHGSAALQWLCNLADRHQVPMALDPKPFGDQTLNKTDLTAWYGRYGFKKKQGEGMVREPDGVPDPKLAYNEDAWNDTRNQYEFGSPTYTTPKDEQEWKQRGDRRHEWDQSALAALSLGKITPADARARDLHVPDVSVEDFKPLPQHLYHVTTAASKVFYEGLKTRYELVMMSGTGLGGGTDKAISFTDDLSIARGIYHAVIQAHTVLNGKLTIPEMIARARSGAGADKPWIEEIVGGIGGRVLEDGTNTELERLERGMMVETAHGKGPEDMPGWTPRKHSYHWTGGDGIERYLDWERPMTEEEKTKATFAFFKTWSYWREHAGGAMDPLFFLTDIKALAAVDPEDIAILEYRPAPGAMGTHSNGLREWRTYSGKAVEFVQETRPGAKTAAEAVDPDWEPLQDLLKENYERAGSAKKTIVSRNPEIALFKDKFGSQRFVRYEDGAPVCALQIVVDRDTQLVANLYTAPEFRRRGFARELFQIARKRYPKLQHSKHLTEDGKGFADKNAAEASGLRPQIEAIMADMMKDVDAAFDTEDGQIKDSGNPWSNCTQGARHIINQVGRGEIWGYQKKDNPTAELADGDGEGGHDFAIIDDLLVDFWAHDYKDTPGIIRLSDKAQIAELYGDRALWSKGSKVVAKTANDRETAAAFRWYHGTSKENGKKILATGELRPGMERNSGGPAPQPDAVYITFDKVMAEQYAEGDGVIFEVRVDDPANLIPDEDSLGQLLDSGEINGHPYPDEIFDIYWRVGYEGDPAIPKEKRREYIRTLANETMKVPMFLGGCRRLARYLAKHKPEIVRDIIRDSGKAAHIGPVKVLRRVRRTASFSCVACESGDCFKHALITTGQALSKQKAGGASALPRSWNGFVAQFGGIAGLFKKIYSNETGDWSGDPTSEEDVQDLHACYDKGIAFTRQAYQKGKLHVYRALYLPEGVTSLDKTRVGTSWTLDQSQAIPHHADHDGNEHLSKCVLRANVTKDQVDWTQTLLKNMDPVFGQEQEICIKPGAQIRVQSWYKETEGQFEYNGEVRKTVHREQYGWGKEPVTASKIDNPKLDEFEVTAAANISYQRIDIDEDYGSVHGTVSRDPKVVKEYVQDYDVRGDDHEPAKIKLVKGTAVAFLKNIDVHPEQRGKGYGTKLLNNFLGRAKDAGATACILMADVLNGNNFDLEEWYERHGFYRLWESGEGDPVLFMSPIEIKRTAKKASEVLKTAAHPETLYHSIEPYYREYIQEHGLIPKNYGRKGVYLATNAQQSELSEPAHFDHWEVNVQGLKVEPDPMGFSSRDEEAGTPWFVCYQTIAPNRLKLLTTEYTPQRSFSPKRAMKINVPESEHRHFWEEPPAGHEEFWAFRFKPKASLGDRVVFHMDKQAVAEAVISRIEPPGKTACEQTGRFGNRWKVFWTPESFRKIAAKTAIPTTDRTPVTETKQAAPALYHCAPTKIRQQIQEHGIDGEHATTRSVDNRGFYGFKKLWEAKFYAMEMAWKEPEEPFDIWKVAPTPDSLVEHDEIMYGEQFTAYSAMHCDTAAPAANVKLIATYDPAKDTNGVRKVKQAAMPRHNDAQVQTLREIDARAGDDFMEWLQDLIGDDTNPTFLEVWDDDESRLDYLSDWLQEVHSIAIEEHGYVEFWRLEPDVERLIGDLPVVVYHHTSSSVVPKIKREGLRADVKRINTHQNSGAGVYVTTELSGPAVNGYHSHAVQKNRKGGRPVTLSIKTYLSELEPDPDDQDIQSGATQYVLPYVAPRDIIWDESHAKTSAEKTMTPCDSLRS